MSDIIKGPVSATEGSPSAQKQDLLRQPTLMIHTTEDGTLTAVTDMPRPSPQTFGRVVCGAAGGIIHGSLLLWPLLVNKSTWISMQR